MERTQLHLALGSNQGDREANLLRAVEALDEGLGVRHSALSAFRTYPAWGFDGAAFLNGTVRYEIPQAGQDPQLFALAVLDLAKSIERSLGRTGEAETDASGQRVYHDRPIDIDLLFYGSLRMVTQRLTLPHKLMKERDFVMEPLQQTATPWLRAQFPEIFD